MSDWYNGYSPAERSAKRMFRKRGRVQVPPATPPCDLCGDPASPARYHSEDYSQPYSWERGRAVYALCRACDSRLHKRFGAPETWAQLLAFVRRGWYGREVSTIARRSARSAQRGRATPQPPSDRVMRALPAVTWWEKLLTDSASLRATWARPRP